MKSRGGWDVKKIWELTGSVKGFYAIHKPGTEAESCPIFHYPDGRAVGAFSVNEPPTYGQHPADIVDFTEEDIHKEKE